MTTQQTRLACPTPWTIGAIAAVSVPKPTPPPNLYAGGKERQAIILPAHSGESPHECSTVRSDATDSARGYGTAYQPGTNPQPPTR